MERRFLLALAVGTLASGLVLSQPGAAGAAPADPLQTVRALESVLVGVTEAVRPSVVLLEVHGSSLAGERLPPGAERFFPVDGLGSGVIIDSEGTILTNHHVVHGADRVDVILFDGRNFRAEVIATSVESDVGIVRLLEAPDDLVVAELGDSSGLQPGQFALAVGAPLGYSRSVTVGHISALHRSAIGQRSPGMIAPGFEDLVIQDFIQVDTAINPGNSGGPLIDLDGKVIGVNTAIMAAPGGGLGFAIPINLALRIKDELLKEGRVRVGWLGVRMTDNTRALDEAFDRKIGQGAMIQEVLDGSPASGAHFEPDDVVVSFAGRKIRSSNDLRSAVAVSPIGESLEADVWRFERGRDVLKTLKVTLGERPERVSSVGSRSAAPVPETASVAAAAGPHEDFFARQLGVALEATSRSVNSHLGRRARAGGVHVRKVAPGGRGAQAGLLPGDVLLEVGGVEVNSPEDVHGRLTELRREFVPLVVERKGARKYLSVERPR